MPWTTFGSTPPIIVPHHDSKYTVTPQQAPTPYSVDDQQYVLQQTRTGVPTALEFNVDFGTFEGLDQIDFQAFDAVFGGDVWEFPSPLEDAVGTETMTDPSMQMPG